MLEVLYAIIAVTALAAFVAFAFAFGVRRAMWACLLLLPLRIVLPTEVGQLIGFENLFLVPDMLLPIVFLVWLAKELASHRGGPGESERSRARLIPRVLLVALGAIIVSFRPGISLRDYASELQKWTVYVFAFVLVSQGIRTPRHLAQTVTVLLVAGLIATLRDLPTYLSLLKLPDEIGYVPNRDAFLFSVYSLERYQGTGWPLFINTLLLFVFTRLALRGRSIGLVGRGALIGYGGLLLALLALSFYRGDWLAIVIALSFGVLFSGLRSMRAVRAGLMVMVVGAAIFAVLAGEKLTSGVQARAESLLAPTADRDVIVRFDAMAEAWQMFREHPLTGIGAGQYGRNFDAYAGQQLYGRAQDASYFQQANSDYFQYLATTGIVGVTALGALFLSFLAWARRLALAPETDPDTAAILVGCFLAIVAVLGNALSQDPMWDKSYGVLTFTLFGMVWAAGSWWADAPAPRTEPAAQPLPAAASR